MPQIDIWLAKSDSNGITFLPNTTIEFKPTAKYNSTSQVVLPKPFEVVTNEDGYATVYLTPTNPTFAWSIRERTYNGEDFYVEIPEDAGITLNYKDLVRLDPITLEPTNQVEAWNNLQTQINNLQAEVDTIAPLTVNLKTPVDNNITLTSTDVGAVSITGGTVTGNLSVTGYLEGHKVITAQNQTGTTIPKGSVVYISGAAGNNTLISLAQANGEATSSKTMGVTYEAIAQGSTGKVLTEGYLEGINTNVANVGDPIYLSSTVAGGMVYGQANKPTAPIHLVAIGFVTRKNSSNGRIFVKVQNGYELDELHTVKITNPQHGDILTYDSISQLWVNRQPI